MTTKNHVRGAVSSLAVSSTSQGTINEGCSERRTLAKRMNKQDRKMLLTEFKATNGYTLLDELCSFVGECTAGRVSQETDGAPRFEVKAIMSGEERRTARRNGAFSVAIRPINWFENKEFYNILDMYNDVEFSGVRYADFNQYSKKMVVSPQYRMVDDIERIDVYQSALIGTLTGFLRTGDLDMASMVRLLMISLRNSIPEKLDEKDKRTIVLNAQKNKDHFKTLLHERQGSHDNSVKYKNFVKKCDPMMYFYMLYTMMVEDTESFHKSLVMDLESVLFGLFTQSLLGQYGCTIDGIEASLLRAILERVMKQVPAINMNDIVDRDKLVQYLHEQAGKNVERELRYWAFLVMVQRCLFTDRLMTATDFARAIVVIRDNVCKCTGILTFCRLIAPSAGNYLTDEIMAEYILTASTGGIKIFVPESKGDAKTENKGEHKAEFKILQTSMLSSICSCTPAIDQQLLRNIKVIEETAKRSADIKADMQKMLDEAKKKSESKGDSKGETKNENLEQTESEDTDALDTALGLWDRTIGKDTKLCHTGKRSQAFRETLMSTASGGTMMHYRICRHLIRMGDKYKLLGDRRAERFMVASVDRNSVIYRILGGDRYGNQPLKLTGRKRNTRYSGYAGRGRDDGSVNLSRALETKRQLTKSKGDTKSAISPIVFITSSRAIEIVASIQKAIDAGLVPTECAICLESGKMIALHGDDRHSVCVACSRVLATCPFCRHAL